MKIKKTAKVNIELTDEEVSLFMELLSLAQSHASAPKLKQFIKEMQDTTL